MKRFFEKIKNWLKTEKVVKRSTLILLCLSVFACGILYTFLVTSDTCNNESDIENVSLTSNTETNVDDDILLEDDSPFFTSIEEYSIIENSVGNQLVVEDFSLDLPTVKRPDITGNEIKEIYDYIYKYANVGLFEPYDDDLHFVDYPVRRVPYLTYGEYENMLYLPESTFAMKMYTTVSSKTDSGLTFRIDENGIIHINGYSSSSSYLLLDISDLIKYNFLDLGKSYCIYTTPIANYSNIIKNYYVSTFYGGTRDSISSCVYKFNKGACFSKSVRFPTDVDLQFLFGAGTYDDLQIKVGFVANDTFNKKWQYASTDMLNKLEFASCSQIVYDMYRISIFGFNKAYNNFDNYADLLEDNVYNSRATFIDMLSSVVSAPINFMKDTLNFSLFGFNLFNILASILTLILTAFVVKKLL